MICLSVMILLMGGCSGSSEDSRSIVYEDMKTSFEQSGLLSANIGIFSRTEADSSVTYGEGGSGGAVLNEKMRLTGIITGGSFSPDGKTFRCGGLIPVSEIRIFLQGQPGRG